MMRCRPLLGTYVEIAVDGGEEGSVAAVIARAFEAVEEVGRLMSFHDRDSELSLINAAGAGDEMTVDARTFAVLELALELHAATEGSFDCGVGAQLVHWGLLPAHAEAAWQAWPARCSIADIELLALHRIRIRRPVCLDLGGIAKGFAVDRAIEVLARAGIAQAVVNAGGDLRVLGERPHPIHVRRAKDPRQLAYLGDLSDGAMATSAPYFSERTGSEGPKCALVDPATGNAITEPASYTVLAPTCALADGLTKALAVDGRISDACLSRYGATALSST